MKIEILFPEICYLYGDKGNITYLKKCLPEAKFIETHLNDIPTFTNEEVSLIYMCSMTEKGQDKVIEKLYPYKEKLQELINNNVCVLLTGNSFEVFTKYIETEEEKIEALGILNFYSKRYIPKRFNSLFMGEFNNSKVVGYTSRFSHTFGDNSNNYLFKVIKGIGINEQSKFEGIRINNLFASYLLGPLLIQNPYFTEYLLKTIKPDATIALEEELKKAYEIRKEELSSDIALS